MGRTSAPITRSSTTTKRGSTPVGRALLARIARALLLGAQALSTVEGAVREASPITIDYKHRVSRRHTFHGALEQFVLFRLVEEIMKHWDQRSVRKGGELNSQTTKKPVALIGLGEETTYTSELIA